ncbi:MAG: NAD-dependent epimerase/dehydratase family protein [Kofleriaceae bacterium]|nr:NAD-dependent epimerase/dehydratase family protein [Kofleriaceae bacterium]MCL4223078.1 NAD-dependent epimerase/dehydratase family protein [Myxococcales bacterium]
MPLAVITGASGLLGSNLAAALRARRVHVRALRRRTTRIDHLADLDIEWVYGDLDDAPSLAHAFAGADAVFHCAAAVAVSPTVTPALRRANVDGTARVLRAVEQAGVGRLVHVSSVVAVGVSEDGRPCTEDARWNFADHGLDDGYCRTKREAEELVTAAARRGLDAVIVNPGFMLGPRDARPSTGRIVVDLVRGRVPVYPAGANCFVDVRDVARGAIAAWERGRAGRRYILGGHNLPYRELFARIARVAGVRPPRLPAPRLAALAAGLAGDAYQRLTGKEPRFGSVEARYAYTDRFQFSSARAEAELGYRAGALDAAIGDALAWFRQQGMV